MFVAVLDTEFDMRCAGCGCAFSSGALFGQHLHSKPACAEAEASSISRPIKHRVRRTIDFKCNVLGDLKQLKSRFVPHAQTVTCKMHGGVSKQDISKWNSDSLKLFCAQANGHGHKRKLQNFSLVYYPRVEDDLYVNFLIRRESLGLPASDRWIQREMRLVLEEHQPPDWKNFRSSPGWLSGFKRRYRISSQARTNKKEVPILERLPTLQKFHRWLHGVRCSTPHTCPRYGRFSGCHIFHMDQVTICSVACLLCKSRSVLKMSLCIKHVDPPRFRP